MTYRDKIAGILFSMVMIILPLYLVSYYFIMTPSFFEGVIIHYQLPIHLNLSEEQITGAVKKLFQFLRSERDNLHCLVNFNGGRDEFFHAGEIKHVTNIRDILKVFKVYTFVHFSLAMISFSWLVYKKKLHIVFKTYFIMFGLMFLIFLTLGFSYFINSTKVINNLHKLIFQDNFWILNPATDRLIWLFPETMILKIIFYLGLSQLVPFFVLIGVRIILNKTYTSD